LNRIQTSTKNSYVVYVDNSILNFIYYRLDHLLSKLDELLDSMSEDMNQKIDNLNKNVDVLLNKNQK